MRAYQRDYKRKYRKRYPNYVRDYQRSHRESVRENQRRYKASEKGLAYKMLERQRRLERLYGLQEGGYEALLQAQGGVCAICGGGPRGSRKGMFQVDHSHMTGKVRGLLCMPCNTMLGQAGDSINRLQNAISYIEKKG